MLEELIFVYSKPPYSPTESKLKDIHHCLTITLCSNMIYAWIPFVELDFRHEDYNNRKEVKL